MVSDRRHVALSLRGAKGKGDVHWHCTMSKAKRSMQVVLSADRMFKRGITRDRSIGPVVLAFFAGPLVDELRFPLDSRLWPFRWSASRGFGIAGRTDLQGLGLWGHSLLTSSPSPRLPSWVASRWTGERGVDGGRFGVEGTARRAVKRFDPCQDHQRRKHSTGLDLPIKSECAVIEEDQIPS